MKNFLRFTLATATAIGLAAALPVQAKPAAYADVPARAIESLGTPLSQPTRTRIVSMQLPAVQKVLDRAPPLAGIDGKTVLPVLRLPLPDGRELSFRIAQSEVMAPVLAAKYPMIKTYVGTATSDASITGRFQMDPRGFRAQMFTPEGTAYIDPYSRADTRNYQVYYRQDLPTRSPGPDTVVEKPISGPAVKLRAGAPSVQLPGIASRGVSISGNLRTYRLALAATYQYSVFHDPLTAENPVPRKPIVLAEQVNLVNRVSGVYERELGLRLVLIPNNDELIFNTPANPYADVDPTGIASGTAFLAINTAVIDGIIGTENYDIGHVSSTGGGGVAGLGIVCVELFKGRGVTGLPSPVGDAYYIDFVAHEMGHQFGGNHTWNGTTGSCSDDNRNIPTAYEPGSGVTIMAYAGICGAQNIAANSIDTFHGTSFDEIVEYTRNSDGATCGTLTTIQNTPPSVVTPRNGFTIPRQTPFELTGAACDADGDTVKYQWEEFDLGPGGAPNAGANNTGPIFRNFLPTASATRVFPKIEDIIDNQQRIGEILPNVSRTMKFRLTARDYKQFPGSGGVASADLNFNVTDSAGPFLVLVPNTATTYTGRQTLDTSWDVANTTAAPVSCPLVDISLSTDGGRTYPTALATGVANDGAQEVTLPNIDTTTARIKVKCGNNAFFDISNADFTIVKAPNTAPVPRLAATPTTGTRPLVVNFDAATSSDAEDTTVAGYALDFGDGSPVVTQAQPGFSHTYSTAGDFTASLSVTDSEGLRSATAATVLIKVSEVAQQAVAPFTFTERKDVPTNSFISSESVTLGGFTGSLPISVSEGLQYSLDGGAFTVAAGSVGTGTRLVVRHVSASAENTAKTSTVTVGSGETAYSTTFKSITTTLDRVPDAFDFGTKTEQAPGATVTSAPKTLTGFDEATIVAGPGIMYRIGSGAFTNARGTLRKDEVLTVQHSASSSSLGYTKTYLKVGGVTGYFTTRTRK